MEKLSKLALVAGLLVCADIRGAYAQTSEEAFYQQWVEYRDDHISVAFNQIPVLDAFMPSVRKPAFSLACHPQLMVNC